jgi:SAM-dependent methyltransferase
MVSACWRSAVAEVAKRGVHESNFFVEATALGGKAIEKVDVLHVDHSNPKATLVGDITVANDLPKAAFDAIICTYVLHLIFDVHGAIRGLHDLLKPGGTLLLAVPQTSMDDPYYSEFWRFTTRGLRRSLEQTFRPEDIQIASFGNSLVTAGELRGLVAEEFSPSELAVHDERFATLHCARVRRGG